LSTSQTAILSGRPADVLLTEVTAMYFPAADIMPQGGSHEPYHLTFCAKWDSYITYFPALKQNMSVK